MTWKEAESFDATDPYFRMQQEGRGPVGSTKNQLAEAFIRGIEVGAEYPSLAGDGDAMYEAFKIWYNRDLT